MRQPPEPLCPSLSPARAHTGRAAAPRTFLLRVRLPLALAPLLLRPLAGQERGQHFEAGAGRLLLGWAKQGRQLCKFKEARARGAGGWSLGGRRAVGNAPASERPADGAIRRRRAARRAELPPCPAAAARRAPMAGLMEPCAPPAGSPTPCRASRASAEPKLVIASAVALAVEPASEETLRDSEALTMSSSRHSTL